jgi:hypothetical protein
VDILDKSYPMAIPWISYGKAIPWLSHGYPEKGRKGPKWAKIRGKIGCSLVMARLPAEFQILDIAAAKIKKGNSSGQNRKNAGNIGKLARCDKRAVFSVERD